MNGKGKRWVGEGEMNGKGRDDPKRKKKMNGKGREMNGKREER